ncbi:MAG TPA: RNA methyltransferase [Puia sp.]|nr:RNA methyltransferase [Puia sp.]
MLVKSQVKYIQSLGQKKFRDEDGSFIAEGVKIINELLFASNTFLTGLFATENWIENNKAILKDLSPDKVNPVKESELGRISFLQTPNEVLGIFKKPVFKSAGIEKTITLLLDEIQDPGNLGTIIRTADWFNIKKIFCSKDSADVFNPKVVQSTMGSIARVEVMHADLQTILDNNSGMPVYAATLNGENIFETKKISKGFILIGNESKGIKSELLKSSVHQITIPKLGNAESLNAAVAAGIVMSALCV